MLQTTCDSCHHSSPEPRTCRHCVCGCYPRAQDCIVRICQDCGAHHPLATAICDCGRSLTTSEINFICGSCDTEAKYDDASGMFLNKKTLAAMPEAGEPLCPYCYKSVTSHLPHCPRCDATWLVPMTTCFACGYQTVIEQAKNSLSKPLRRPWVAASAIAAAILIAVFSWRYSHGRVVDEEKPGGVVVGKATPAEIPRPKPPEHTRGSKVDNPKPVDLHKEQGKPLPLHVFPSPPPAPKLPKPLETKRKLTPPSIIETTNKPPSQPIPEQPAPSIRLKPPVDTANTGSTTTGNNSAPFSIARNDAPPVTVERPTRAPYASSPAKVPQKGELVWTGVLSKQQQIVIQGNTTSTGVLTGHLPSSPVRIFPGPKDKVAVIQSPSEMNGWKLLLRATGNGEAELHIQWQELQGW